MQRVHMLVDEKQTELKGYLDLHLRQFNVGLFKPDEPEVPATMTDNSIKIGGNVTGSAIQQGSPGALQIIRADATTFDNAKVAIENRAPESPERTEILNALAELRTAMESSGGKTGTSDYLAKYKSFMDLAAAHMTILTILAPFIPVLTAWL
jgi:hypothetical protein